MKLTHKKFLGAALIAGAALVSAAHADNVFVGYADGLRGGVFFPSPWHGDPGVVFVGTLDDGGDAGAIRIDNTSGATQTISVSVSAPWAGMFDYDLWGPRVVGAGMKLILTETAHYNFDTSDLAALTDPLHPLADGSMVGASEVKVTIDGVTTHYFDTGHVLNTGGFDFAVFGNEALGWRPIGTTGITDRTNQNVPDATGFGTMILALGSLAGFSRLRRRGTAA